MSLEYETRQQNSALTALKQRAVPPTLTDQKPNVLYTMPVQTVERLEALSQRVEFFQGDLLAPLKAKGELLNAIVSNPPYIPKADIAALAADVKAYEPMGALDGGEDGLDFYRALADHYKAVLRPGGALVLEIGWQQRQAVTGLLAAAGWTGIQCRQDYGGNDRCIMARA